MNKTAQCIEARNSNAAEAHNTPQSEKKGAPSKNMQFVNLAQPTRIVS
jgi:hypothetical protein